MGLFPVVICAKKKSKMQLFVRGSLGTYVLEADSFVDLHDQITEAEGSDLVNIFLSGKPLEEENFGEIAVENVTLDVAVPIKGGKVHGSLARAGKVRGRTPKVEAGEKKKTGRAKRRIQYNRRFVNVVQTFGRRRGPNAN